MDIYTATGLVGFLGYVMAYGLLQIGKLDGNGVPYTLANIGAASLVLVSLFRDFNLASALIQITWITLGLVGMLLRWAGSTSKATPAPAPIPISAQVTARLGS